MTKKAKRSGYAPPLRADLKIILPCNVAGEIAGANIVGDGLGVLAGLGMAVAARVAVGVVVRVSGVAVTVGKFVIFNGAVASLVGVRAAEATDVFVAVGLLASWVALAVSVAKMLKAIAVSVARESGVAGGVGIAVCVHATDSALR